MEKAKKQHVLIVCFILSTLMLLYELHSVQSINMIKTGRDMSISPLYKTKGMLTEQEKNEDSLENDNREFMRRMKNRMEERRKRAHDTCKKLGLTGSGKDVVKFISSKKFKLVYCPVPKTGCSNMKRVMLALNGSENNTKNIFPKNVIGQSYLLHQTVARNFTIRSNGFPEFVKKKNYTRFIVVRHPFERALSAYKNKLTKQWNGKVPHFEKRARLIREKYGTEDRRNATGEIPTFTEFIDYIYDANNTNINGRDNHWNSVRVICHPCQNDFDVIAKIETIEEDLKYILNLVGAPRSLEMPKGYSKSGKSQTNIYTDPELKDLGSESLNKLYQVYKWDFEMFAYNKSELQERFPKQ